MADIATNAGENKIIMPMPNYLSYTPWSFVLPAIGSLITIITTVYLFVRTEAKGYLPSISEAGACKASYKIYSIGMVSCAGLFFNAVSMWCRFRIEFMRQIDGFAGLLTYMCMFFVHLNAFLAFFFMGFQGVIRIDLTKPMDSHRRAAGMFFIFGFVLCLFMNSIENFNDNMKELNGEPENKLHNQFPSLPRSINIIRRLLIFGIVALMAAAGAVGARVESILTMSTSPELQMSAQKHYITLFAIIQYVFVCILMAFLLTFGWSTEFYQEASLLLSSKKAK